MKIVVIVIFILVAIFIKNTRLYKKQIYKFNTVANITVTEKEDIKKIESIFEKYDGILNENYGKIKELNDNKKIVNREVADAIRASLKYNNEHLDMTVKDLIKVWDKAKDENKLPNKEDVKEAQSKVDFKSVQVLLDKVTTKENITLAAFAKGYILDGVAENIKSKDYIVNLGGNIVVGSKEKVIGIQDPKNNTGNVAATVKVKNKFVSTSGDYQQYFEVDGKKYHHILDLKTGYPVNNNLRSAVVISNEGLMSDALSTLAYAMGENCMKLKDEYDIDIIYITKDDKIVSTIHLDYVKEGYSYEKIR